MDQQGKKIGLWCIAVALATCAPQSHAQTNVSFDTALRGERPSTSSFAAKSAYPATPPTTLEEALHDLFRSADTVFSGEVTEIKRGESAVVVSWRVEDVVRGTAGGVYDLREWPGLWDGNGARYSVGEHALVMLHAPSVAGYASPVADGIIPMRGDGPNSILDLRMPAQHVAVTDAARLRPLEALRSAGGSLALSDALQARAAALSHRVTPLQRAPDDSSGTSGQSASGRTAATPSGESNGGVDGAMVLGMLHAWQREDAAAR